MLGFFLIFQELVSKPLFGSNMKMWLYGFGL
jgi:hypothetical protein